MFSPAAVFSAVSSASLRFHLRARTQEAHQKLDATIGTLESMPAYRRYLRGQHAFRAPLERALAQLAWPAAFDGYRPLAILPALAADLADLGVIPQITRDDAELSQRLAEPAVLIGTLYVLEGSSLGAALLYRCARDLGLDEGFGARHLARQAGNGEGWRRFLAVMQKQRLDPERAVQAANAMFARALDAFVAAERDPLGGAVAALRVRHG
jgi:heme oxygenase